MTDNSKKSDDKPTSSSDAAIIYTTPYCQFCKHVKAYLDERHIAWREVDVLADPDMAEEMIRKSGQMGVPVTDLHGEIIIGFNKAKLDQVTAAS